MWISNVVGETNGVAALIFAFVHLHLAFVHFVFSHCCEQSFSFAPTKFSLSLWKTIEINIHPPTYLRFERRNFRCHLSLFVVQPQSEGGTTFGQHFALQLDIVATIWRSLQLPLKIRETGGHEVGKIVEVGERVAHKQDAQCGCICVWVCHAIDCDFVTKLTCWRAKQVLPVIANLQSKRRHDMHFTCTTPDIRRDFLLSFSFSFSFCFLSWDSGFWIGTADLAKLVGIIPVLLNKCM